MQSVNLAIGALHVEAGLPHWEVNCHIDLDAAQGNVRMLDIIQD
jgi:hypothetical protein